MLANPTKTLTVSQLTAMIAYALESRPDLKNVLVEGEVSNFGERGGHWYFVLKDQGANLNCVCFATYNAGVKFKVDDGMKLLVHGSVEVFRERGRLQLYIDRLEPAGVGALELQIRQLTDRLRKEGLFDESRKRPLKAVPTKIAVVTSKSAAAWQDVCRVIARRAPYLEMVLVPTAVQGAQAAGEIAAAIARAQTILGVDTIMLIRGGGSFEDLLPFQTEVVARAIASSKIPVVTGVGHETDSSLADYAADRVAPTPSAAAEVVAAPREGLLAEVAHLSTRIERLVLQGLESRKSRLSSERRALLAQSPLARIARMREAVSAQRQRLDSVSKRQLEKLRSRLNIDLTGLLAYSPISTLERGYALVEDSAGGIIARLSGVSSGDQLTLRWFDGTAKVAVLEVKPDAG
jgi:exodeoxyribonuclease VII large subunit